MKEILGTVNPAFPNPMWSWNTQTLHHISQDYASWDTLWETPLTSLGGPQHVHSILTAGCFPGLAETSFLL